MRTSRAVSAARLFCARMRWGAACGCFVCELFAGRVCERFAVCETNSRTFQDLICVLWSRNVRELVQEATKVGFRRRSAGAEGEGNAWRYTGARRRASVWVNRECCIKEEGPRCATPLFSVCVMEALSSARRSCCSARRRSSRRRRCAARGSSGRRRCRCRSESCSCRCRPAAGSTRAASP